MDAGFRRRSSCNSKATRQRSSECKFRDHFHFRFLRIWRLNKSSALRLVQYATHRLNRWPLRPFIFGSSFKTPHKVGETSMSTVRYLNGGIAMRKRIFAILAALFAATSAMAAQQLGDIRPRPIFGKCPAGMEMNAATNACVAVAPNGCCAPNPQRAVCANAAPGQQRWAGRPSDVQSQAVICPR
jgi:hypothetical protein